MSLTPTEEAQTRQLIAQEAPLLTLAASEATIISKLGATKVNLSQLPAATTVADADLLLIRQGTTDKGVPASALKTYATSAASETVAGIVRLATDAEVAAATSRSIAVDPAGLAVSSQKSATITAVATGTADALVATFVPAITTVANQTILVRATAANATTTPTINPGSGAIVIVKGNNLPLAIGDISGAGHWLEITLDATLTKANLQNPATGITSNITQPQFNNTTLGASTAFVQRALGNAQGVFTYTTSTTIAASNAGGIIFVPGGTGSITLALPTGVPAGSMLRVYNNSSSTVTLTGTSITSGTYSATSIQLPGYRAYDFYTDGSNDWVVTQGDPFNMYSVPQAWQNVTGSRALSTTYTNSTGREIKIAASFSSTSSSTFKSFINGSLLYQNDSAGVSFTVGLCFTVPSNATYQITSSAGTVTTIVWSEER